MVYVRTGAFTAEEEPSGLALRCIGDRSGIFLKVKKLNAVSSREKISFLFEC